MGERSLSLSHTARDWRVADKRGYELNHVFTDSYSQLFPEEKGYMLPMVLYARKINQH